MALIAPQTSFPPIMVPPPPWATQSFAPLAMQAAAARGCRPGPPRSSHVSRSPPSFMVPPASTFGALGQASPPAAPQAIPQIGCAKETSLNSFKETFSFQSLESANTREVEEDLILHPKFSRRVPATQFDADAAAILAGAFSSSLAMGKPFPSLEKPLDPAAAQQAAEWRVALQEASKPHLLSDLLEARHDAQRIFLMRHGESEGNVSKRDVPDPHLTQLGVLQAKSWQEEIGEFGADIVLVSPLRRTVQTACFAFSHEQVPFRLCRFAREIGWGCGENTISLDKASMEQMLTGLPHGDDIRGIDEALVAAPDDPIDELASLQRLKVAIASRPERTVVVVCHYGVISALTGCRAKNCDVYECTWGEDGELKVSARHKPPLSQQQCICG